MQLDQRLRGGLLTLGAFCAWGLMPLYFKAVSAAPALQILAHRALWAAVLLLVAVLPVVVKRLLKSRAEKASASHTQWTTLKKSVKEDQTKYALKSSTHKEYFSLATPTATQLIEAASAKALLGPEAEKESPDQSGEQDKGRDQAPSSGS